MLVLLYPALNDFQLFSRNSSYSGHRLVVVLIDYAHVKVLKAELNSFEMDYLNLVDAYQEERRLGQAD